MALVKQTFPGTAPAELEISPDFLNNQITISDLLTGTATFEALSADSGAYEVIENGEIDLTQTKTFDLLDFQLRGLRVTVSASMQFTITVRQTKRP